MSEHKQFEILCALAVVGQVSDADLRELKLHIEGCFDCKNRMSDFAQISAQVLSLAGERYSNVPSPKAITARFVERARAEGIPLHDSGQMMPSDFSFGPLGWKGSCAAALLVIAIIAGGISKSMRWRAQSADTVTAAKLEVPDAPSLQTKIVQGRSSLQRTKLAPVRRRMRVPSARLQTEHAPSLPNSEEDGSFGSELGSPGAQYSANLDAQLFLNALKGEHPTHDSSSSRSWLFAPGLAASTEHGPRVSAYSAYYVGPDPRNLPATFAIMSPLQDFSFRLDRPLFGSPRARSQWHPNIGWGKVWLKTFRPASLPKSKDLSQFHQDVFDQKWSFSKDLKVDQQ